jgi:hypothetical protein
MPNNSNGNEIRKFLVSILHDDIVKIQNVPVIHKIIPDHEVKIVKQPSVINKIPNTIPEIPNSRSKQ